MKSAIPAAQAVLRAGWDVTIAPLDSCSRIRLAGGRYQAVLGSAKPLTQAILANDRTWLESFEWLPELGRRPDPEVESTVLYDTAAIHLASSGELLTIERLGIRVLEDGMTVIDDRAKQIRCATSWKDLGAFEEFRVQRLT